MSLFYFLSDRKYKNSVYPTKASQEVAIVAIALKYIEKLAQVEYQGIGINFRGYVLFEQKNNTARNYIFGNLLNSGTWQEFRTSPVQAAI
jgi:hypothetical protein